MSAGQYTLECARSDTLIENRRKKCQVSGKFLAIELLDCEKIIQMVTRYPGYRGGTLSRSRVRWGPWGTRRVGYFEPWDYLTDAGIVAKTLDYRDSLAGDQDIGK